MSRPRLKPDDMAPGYLALVLKLSIDTDIKPMDLANFMIDNLGALREGFKASGEPATNPRVENVEAIYIRRQFKAAQVSA